MNQNNSKSKSIFQYAAHIIVIICMMVFCFCLGGGLSKHITESKYQEYYEKSEILLDSISSWYGHKAFQDSIMNTQTYYEYELAKEHLSE